MRHFPIIATPKNKFSVGVEGMLFRAGQSERPVPLKPFVFRTRDGFMIGLAMEPSKGSPCAGCVELWLRQRNVWVEPAGLSDLNVRRDLIGDLLEENCAHVFYEITADGSSTRLDCLVFPHPQCACQRGNYVAPRQISKRTNFAFSPLFQLKCARFGTPNGNLWLTSAMGDAPLTGQRLTAFGVAEDKEKSRFQAVDSWMKKAAAVDSIEARGEALKAEILQTGARQLLAPSVLDKSGLDISGAGGTREEAVLSALYQLARVRTLRRYAVSGKNPMLIVGANNWIRTRVPFFLLQQYDLHLLFYPNSMPAWVVGIAAFSRTRTEGKPVFVFGSDGTIEGALQMAIGRILEACHPNDDFSGTVEDTRDARELGHASKLNLWWTHWIYRCPKISLKDVLHLENYPKTLDHWRDFLRDGEEPVGILDMNTSYFPLGIRHLVKLNIQGEAAKTTRNINGIGTWATFQDSFA